MNEQEGFRLVEQKTNFFMQMGEGNVSFQFHMNVRKTLLNRFKYWMFFQFFPFKLVRWDNDKL